MHFYWNPSSDAFIIPWIHRPVAWYGIFFLIGLLIAYFFLHKIFTRFLYRSQSFSEIDIRNETLFFNQLKNTSNKLFKNLLPKNLAFSSSSPLKKESFLLLKKQISEQIAFLLQRKALTRKELELEFPETLFPAHQTSYFLLDRLSWFIIIGMLIGARLGHVFFYDWAYFKNHLWEIVDVWKGIRGLASHGGVIGIILAVWCYHLYIQKWLPKFTYLALLDSIAIVAPITAGFIRIGNFVNQEIIGKPTEMPWGVIFGNSIEKASTIPRHPVQLYETLSYFLIFGFLYLVWKKEKDDPTIHAGKFTGLLFMLLFGMRFFLEFFKEKQAALFSIGSLEMGQILSIPFFCLGFFLFFYAQKKKWEPRLYKFTMLF